MTVILRDERGRFASVQQLIDKIQHPEPLLDQIGKILKASTQARITTTKKSPDGTPWAPWSYATLLARMKDGSASLGILNHTGNLLKSITYQVQGRQVKVGADSSVALYAKYLQEGTLNMPARPFVGISQQDNEAVRIAVRRYLTNK